MNALKYLILFENLDINKSHLINLYLKNEDPLIEEKRPNYQDMLYAIEKACSEVEEDPDFEEKNRNYNNDKGKGTTFLTYVKFTYEKASKPRTSFVSQFDIGKIEKISYVFDDEKNLLIVANENPISIRWLLVYTY